MKTVAQGADVADLDVLRHRRLECWRQTPQTHISTAAEATALVDQLGLVTLYAASPEIPNLFHAYTGDPEAGTTSEWDSPTGHVFGWRWELGRAEAAFYGAIVRNRPTWVHWELLPAVLRLRAELRMPDELYDLGEISLDAYRITQALEEADGAVTTGELRQAAGFPTGKEQRAAYLKAIGALDARLLVAKVFSEGETDMSHALVRTRYPEATQTADDMALEEAADRFLHVYLPHAVYGLPTILARHCKLDPTVLIASFDRLVDGGKAERVRVEGLASPAYAWQGL